MDRRTNKVLGLDLDGVIVDHTENVIFLAESLGFGVKKHEAATDLLKTKIPEAAYEKIQESLYDDPVVALSPPLHRGARRALGFLKAESWPYFLISRRRNPSLAISLLEKRKLWPGFFNEGNTFFVNEKADKNAKAGALGISIYIDDQPSVLNALVSVPHKFLFDRHNAYAGSGGDYKTVHSWEEFIFTLRNQI